MSATSITVRAPARRKRAARSRGATSAFVTKAQVHQMLKSSADETKYYDKAITSTSIDFGGDTYPLSEIPLSSSGAPNMRYGVVVKPRSLEVRWSASTVTGGDLSNTLRFVVVRWRGVPASLTTPGNPPQIDDVLQSSSLGQSTAPLAAYAYYSTGSSSKLMTVLYDSQITISPGGPGGLTGKAIIPLKGTMAFDQSFSADPSNGSLYLAVVSDSGVAPHPAFSFNSRLWFDDES
jgi:hypothetical protein